MRYSRGGQQPHQLGPQRGVGVTFRWRDDDVFYFRGVPVAQLRNNLAKFGLLIADAGRGKLCFSLGDPHG
jgi:hypothetical protein